MPKLKDESITLSDGKLAFVSQNRFRDLIFSGDKCLLCASQTLNEPTKEHIIPNWILKRLGLHNKDITLPNATLYSYAKYVIPCCSGCNYLMGESLENPISRAFESGFDSVNSFVSHRDGLIKLFVWLSFIFIKSHYKDLNLAYERDLRLGKKSIAEELEYDWTDIHHIYCLARSIYSDASISTSALGSLAIFPISSDTEREPFDLIDLTAAKTIAVKIGNVGVVAVLADGGAVMNELDSSLLRRISGPLNFAQFREVVARFACCSLHLKNPPKYATYIRDPDLVTIECSQRDPKPEFFELDRTVFGSLMEMLLYKPMRDLVDVEDYLGKLKDGSVSFLFKSDGSFINHDELTK